MQRKGSLCRSPRRACWERAHDGALFALAVGEYMGLMLREVTTRLKTYIPPGRMRLVLALNKPYWTTRTVILPKHVIEVLQKLRMPAAQKNGNTGR